MTPAAILELLPPHQRLLALSLCLSFGAWGSSALAVALKAPQLWPVLVVLALPMLATVFVGVVLAVRKPPPE